MRRVHWIIMLAVVVLCATSLCPARQAAAEELKPFFVLSWSGYDAMMADLDYVGKLGDNPGLSKATEAILHMLTEGKGLAGIDKKRPWGVVVLPNPDNLATDARTFGFVPVTNFDAMLETLEAFQIRTIDGPNGSRKFDAPGVVPAGTLIKQIGPWAFITNNPAHFDNAPSDPVALLEGAEKRYDLTLSLIVKRIPQPMKDNLVRQLESVAQFMAAMGEAPPTGLQQSITQLKRYSSDLDTMTLGLIANDPSGKTYLDVVTTAKPGTSLARELAEAKVAPSSFAGFYQPGATATANWVGKISESDADLITPLLRKQHEDFLKKLKRQNIGDERYEKVEKLISDMVDVLMATFKAEKADGGAAAWLDSDTATVIAGGHVTDSGKLDGALRQLVKMMTDESPELKNVFKLDAAKHQGITLHTASLPAAALGGGFPWPEMVGENLDVVVGVGPADVYFAMGRDAMSKLTGAIDASKAAAGTSVPPARASLALTQLAEFISVAADNDNDKQQASMIAQLLAAAGSENHVLLTVEPIPGGVRQRIEIEKGLLKAIGAMSQMASSLMGPPAMPPIDVD